MPALLSYVLLFTVVGAGFIFVHLMAGKLVRPAKPDPEKGTIYECGEPTVGSAWVQFDLRFYVIALLFVIFDVEVAFFFPWAAVFGKLNTIADPRLTTAERQEVRDSLLPAHAREVSRSARAAQMTAQVERQMPESANRLAWLAFGDILVFFGILLVGYAYLWKRGDLNWVRSTAAEKEQTQLASRPPPDLTQASAAEVTTAV
jgi:NADH-quinone oxidoreductase subunit A